MERLGPQSVLGVVVRACRARPQAEAAVDPGKCSCLRPPFSLSRARGVLGVVEGWGGHSARDAPRPRWVLGRRAV